MTFIRSTSPQSMLFPLQEFRRWAFSTTTRMLVSAMAENGLDGEVIGVALDGTGSGMTGRSGEGNS